MHHYLRQRRKQKSREHIRNPGRAPNSQVSFFDPTSRTPFTFLSSRITSSLLFSSSGDGTAPSSFKNCVTVGSTRVTRKRPECERISPTKIGPPMGAGGSPPRGNSCGGDPPRRGSRGGGGRGGGQSGPGEEGEGTPQAAPAAAARTVGFGGPDWRR